MRNLKRALSLTLASVMLLGMMVVGSSAAAGYDDVKETDNVEAIEVLQAVEVMVGDDRGFGPDRPVTRNEMAVVMGKLLNLDYNYYTSTCPFTDVADWARGWVGACAANGIVSGRGNGIYDGESTVTAIEAASMMMRALGYFKNLEDYADGFQVVTVRQGSQIGIFEGVGTDATTAMTRNQVATMALNALRSEMVDFTGTPGIDVNGVKVGYRAEYTPRTSTEAKYNAIEGRTSDVASDANHKGQYYIQLGEQLYDGDLRLRDGTDDFERPSRVWEYKGKEIGTYMKKELIRGEYSTAVTGKTLYELLGRAVIDDNNVDYFWNGRADETIAPNNMIRTNTKNYDTTGKGVLTQVFFDPDDDEITIVSINTFLADVDDDYDEKKGELPIVNIYTDLDDAAGVDFGADTKVGVDEVKGIEDYKDGDKIMVQVAWTGSRYEIVNVQDPEVLTEVSLNKYSEENYVARSGEQWDYALDGKNSRGALDEITEYDTKSLTDYTYTLYIDKYGYLIGNERSGGNDEYVFIAGYDFRGSNLATATATASAIFLDGTMANIQVDVNETQKNITEYNDAVGAASYNGNTNTFTGRHDGYQPFNMDTSDIKNKYLSEYNSWFTYTTEVKNGVTIYTLEPVDNWMDVSSTKGEINSASVRLDVTVGSRGSDRAYGNDDSVFLTVDTDAVSEGTIKGISKVNGRYTGVQDVDLKLLTGADLAAEINGTSKNLGWDAAAGHWTTGASDSKYHANVFAVYDDDLYIIGAVIIGDNGGANQDYIYVLDDIKNERVEDGDHYWEVDVAKGGKVETLTIKTSSSKFRAIRNTIQDALNEDTPEAVNGMLKLTYDADGYVTEAVSVDESTSSKKTDVVYGNADVEAGEDIDPDDEKVYLVQFDATAYPGSGTGALGATTFTAKGRTLYASYAGHRGVTVVSDAPVVVLQPTKDSKGNIDYDYEVFSGSKSVENAIKSLAYKGANFQGWVAAVLNANGTAEYLVLSSEICKTIDTIDPDDGPEGVIVDEYPEGVLNVTSTDWLNALDVADAIEAYLTKRGVTDIKYDSPNKTATGTFKGKTVTYTVIVKGNVSPAELAGAEMVSKVLKSIAPEGVNDHNGMITIEGNKMITTNDKDAQWDYINPSNGKTSAATGDLAHFAEGLYNKGARKITFNGTDYTWDSTKTTRSKWVDGSGNTLMKVMTNAMTAQAAGVTSGASKVINLSLTVDGAEIVYTINYTSKAP